MVGALSILLLLFAAALYASLGLPPSIMALAPGDRHVEVESITLT